MVLDKNTSLAERIRTLFREQGITIFSVFPPKAPVLVITGAFGGVVGVDEDEGEDEGDLNKWLNRLVDAFNELAEKAVEALSATLESVVGSILGF